MTALSRRLRARRAEFEQAILSRVRGVSGDSEVTDPEYVAGLRVAVVAAISYGIEAIEVSADNAPPPPIPAELLSQARKAAFNGVGIDIVFRRYFIGYALITDIVVQEAERATTPGQAEVRTALRTISGLFDHLLKVVGAEYRLSRQALTRSFAQRRVEQVRRVLSGEVSQGENLDYYLGDWHLAAIATGRETGELGRALAAVLDRDLLLAHPEPTTAWIWLGGKQPVSAVIAREAAEESVGEIRALTFGEPGQGVYGWRLSHRQAKAALPIALREERGPTCYSEVGLLASVLDDDALQSSLRETYLVPLEEGHDSGGTLRETLRAYFAAGRNTTSTAAALGVSRRTVNNRLRVVEERVKRPLNSCFPELEMALRLDAHSR